MSVMRTCGVRGLTGRGHHRRRLVPILVAFSLLAMTGCTITFPSATPAPPTTLTSPAPDNEATPGSTSPKPTTAADPPSTSPSPTGQDWAEVMSDVRGSVVRLSVSVCTGDPSMGTGFVVGDDLVMTAAHVVEGARSISVQDEDGQLTSASIIAFDFSTDTALVRTEEPMPGDALPFADDEPKEGSELAVIGYPLGSYKLRISEGIVSGLHDRVDYESFSVEHVFTTDAATNPGNSGGPVVDHTGRIIGLVSGGAVWSSDDEATRRPVQGINYMVPGQDAEKNLDRWKDRSAQTTDGCGDDVEAPVDSSFVLDVTINSRHEDAYDLAQTLFLHGESINEGSYASAWTLFTAAQQQRLPLDSWQSGLRTSYWTDLSVDSVTRQGSTALVDARLRTRQDASQGPNGWDCVDWSFRYTMKLVDGIWLLDRAKVLAQDRC